MATAAKRSRQGNAESSISSNPRKNALPFTSDQDERTRVLHDKVFGIELLREKILNYVIHDEEDISRANAATCRLVQHSWLESVHKCLKKNQTPLIHIRLTSPADLSPKSRASQFLSAYATPSRNLESILPYSLQVDYNDELLVEKPFQRYIRWCADGMITLKLMLNNTCSGLVIPVNVFFPALCNLLIFFFRENSHDKPARFFKDLASNTQYILSGCTRLTHVRFVGIDGGMAAAFKTLSLPATITNLKFGGEIAPLEQVVRSSRFPKLTYLTLNINYESESDYHVVYRILGHVRLTLKTLIMNECGIGEEPNQIRINFPVMKALKSLVILSDKGDWGVGVSHLGSNLPVVKTLRLHNITPLALHELVTHNTFESAVELEFNVSEGPTANLVQDLSPSLARCPRAFPYVSDLSITIPVRNDNPLIFQAIFQNMTQLKRLSLELEEVSDSVIGTDRFWNTMFLGGPPEEISADKPADITHLSELCELEIGMTPANANTKVIERLPKAVFKYGFRRMPKLILVYFKGKTTLFHRHSSLPPEDLKRAVIMKRYRLVRSLFRCHPV